MWTLKVFQKIWHNHKLHRHETTSFSATIKPLSCQPSSVNPKAKRLGPTIRFTRYLSHHRETSKYTTFQLNIVVTFIFHLTEDPSTTPVSDGPGNTRTEKLKNEISPKLVLFECLLCQSESSWRTWCPSRLELFYYSPPPFPGNLYPVPPFFCTHVRKMEHPSCTRSWVSILASTSWAQFHNYARLTVA